MERLGWFGRLRFHGKQKDGRIQSGRIAKAVLKIGLFSNPDVDVTPGLKLKYGLGSGPTPLAGSASVSAMGNASDGEVCGGGIEEGFLDIAALKEVALSCREGEFISIARRFGNFPLVFQTCNIGL